MAEHAHLTAGGIVALHHKGEGLGVNAGANGVLIWGIMPNWTSRGSNCRLHWLVRFAMRAKDKKNARPFNAIDS